MTIKFKDIWLNEFSNLKVENHRVGRSDAIEQLSRIFSNFWRQAMLRFRHLALILLSLFPAMAADEVLLEGSALLGFFVGDPDCTDGVKSDTCILSFQISGKAAKLLFDDLRDKTAKSHSLGK
jgi:hypothetical protein